MENEQLIKQRTKLELLIVSLNERTARKTEILKHEINKINDILKTNCNHEWIIDTTDDYNEHTKYICKKCSLTDFESMLTKK